MRKNLFLCAILCIAIFAVTGCNYFSDQNIIEDKTSLSELLITINDMPIHIWKTIGPGNIVIDNKRTSDTIGIDFYSDLYPDYFSTQQEVFRYQTIRDARIDYEYAIKEYGNGDRPPKFKFQSEIADESQISCTYYSNTTFPVCYWVARYNHIVIDFTVWLIPGRMAFTDMESIIKKIDANAGKQILNK